MTRERNFARPGSPFTTSCVANRGAVPATLRTGFSGLETVRAQLEEWLDVVRAERARANLGMQITRPTWKNLVFTGGPGAGKSWAARALAVSYRELGFVEGGQVL